MKDVLYFLLQNIVSHPDDIKIEEAQGEGDGIIFTLHIHKDDMGQVIGKQGRIIRAIRDLIKLVAAKHNKYVDVVLAEDK